MLNHSSTEGAWGLGAAEQGTQSVLIKERLGLGLAEDDRPLGAWFPRFGAA